MPLFSLIMWCIYVRLHISSHFYLEILFLSRLITRQNFVLFLSRETIIMPECDLAHHGICDINRHKIYFLLHISIYLS